MNKEFRFRGEEYGRRGNFCDAVFLRWPDALKNVPIQAYLKSLIFLTIVMLACGFNLYYYLILFDTKN